MTQFVDFISQIPDDVKQKTETQPCSNITLFKPVLYMGGVQFDVSDYHIVFPSENTPDVLFNNKRIHGSLRSILAVNPGDIVTCIKNAPAKPYYSLLIKTSLVQEIAEHMDFLGEIRFNHLLNPFSIELLQLVKSLDREFKRPDRLNLMLDCLETEITVLLLREFKLNRTKHIPLSQDSDSYINLAKEYIQTYFNSNITLSDICDEIHVSQYHFIRTFSKQVGLTPHMYLSKVRIEKAKELLDARHYTVSETAALCGFASTPYFSAVFKKATGYTPAAYKKKI
jgi:AraC-like DNA-binding protein